MYPVQISAKHKLAILPPEENLKNLFPDAKLMELGGQTRLLVPHMPIESFMLRRLGYDVPAPILSNYHWPHPIDEQPFEAQRKTAALLTMHNRAYVLNDMGTGKTRAALWAWDYLRSNGLCGRLLVLAPLSTLKFTWAREVFNTLPERKYAVVHGSKEKRLKLLRDIETEIFIINHDGLKVVLKDLPDDVDTVVIDELAVYRNGGTARTKQLKKICDTTRMKWVWGMTGKPIPRAPTDVWAQCSIVTPATVPRYFTRFRDELMIKVSEFKYVPKDDAVERAFAAMQPAVRFTLDDVQELPEAIYRTVDVDMGPKQAKVYKELAAQCYTAVQNHQITAANAGAVMSKLLQVATGWVYTSEGNTVGLDNDNRLQALMDAINATSSKLLVFMPFKHALEGISKLLTSEDVDHAVVSGDTPAEQRSIIFNLFQNTNKYQVIAAHPQCLAHGITLTAADTVVWYAPVTSLEIYEQANARIRRVGQKHKQLYLHFQSTPVEKRIYSLLQRNQQVQDSLLELFATATAKGVE